MHSYKLCRAADGLCVLGKSQACLVVNSHTGFCLQGRATILTHDRPWNMSESLVNQEEPSQAWNKVNTSAISVNIMSLSHICQRCKYILSFLCCMYFNSSTLASYCVFNGSYCQIHHFSVLFDWNWSISWSESIQMTRVPNACKQRSDNRRPPEKVHFRWSHPTAVAFFRSRPKNSWLRVRAEMQVGCDGLKALPSGPSVWGHTSQTQEHATKHPGFHSKFLETLRNQFPLDITKRKTKKKEKASHFFRNRRMKTGKPRGSLLVKRKRKIHWEPLTVNKDLFIYLRKFSAHARIQLL